MRVFGVSSPRRWRLSWFVLFFLLSSGCSFGIRCDFYVEAESTPVPSLLKPVRTLHVLSRNRPSEFVIEFHDLENRFRFPDRSFDIVFRDPIVAERVNFLRQRALARSKVGVLAGYHAVIKDFRTEVAQDFRYEWIRPEPRVVYLRIHYDIGNLASENFPEAPELAVVGIISELFFNELTDLYAASWRELIDTAEAELKAKGICQADCRQQISDVFRLRTTWCNKLLFYEMLLKGHPNYHLDSFLDRLARIPDYHEVSEAMRTSFTEFYAASLNPKIIEHVWSVPLPSLWEFGMSNPPFVGNL